MNQKLTIVYAGTEAVPFVKVGGLGDVLGALPQEMVRRGHEVYLFIPLYGKIDASKYQLKPLFDGHGFPAVLGQNVFYFHLWYYRSPEQSNLTVYFIENHYFFNREGIYSGNGGNGFADEGTRWTFFQKSILESLKILHIHPDVIHVNDFHTALIPYMMKMQYRPFFDQSISVLTLHNFLFHGVYEPQVLFDAGIPMDQFYPLSVFEFYGKTNFLKTGMTYADAVNTVSPRYAWELQNIPEFSYGLLDTINDIKGKFSGIINGADYHYWNPQTDKYLAKNYTKETLNDKMYNRDLLIKSCRLSASDSTLVMGIVARMTEQKGFSLLFDAWTELSQRDVVLVILASGDKKLERAWAEIARQHPERIYISGDFNEAFAHQIQAGSDVFLMPSQFEPCGLSQMYSLKYATPPIAHATGGLADTILDNHDFQTGYLFTEYDVTGFIGASDRALSDFHDPVRWKQIQDNGMTQDFSWERSAFKYEELYIQTIKNRP